MCFCEKSPHDFVADRAVSDFAPMQPTKYGFENRTLYIQLPLGLQYRICVPAAQDGLSGKAAPILEFAFEAEPHTVNDIELHIYIGHGYGWRSKRKHHKTPGRLLTDGSEVIPKVHEFHILEGSPEIVYIFCLVR